MEPLSLSPGSAYGRSGLERRGSCWHNTMVAQPSEEQQAEEEEQQLQGILRGHVAHRKQQAKISASDGHFFENFTALPDKQESLHFRKKAGESQVFDDEGEEDIMSSKIDHVCKDLPQLSKKEVVDLYRSVLSVIYFRLKAADQTIPPEQELYSYLNDMFKSYVSASEHNSMVLTISKGAPPVTSLIVLVQEARNLTGKDISGLSDPFCVMGVLPQGDSKKPFVHQAHQQDSTCTGRRKDRASRGSTGSSGSGGGSSSSSSSSQDLQSTSIVKQELNPKWNEHFRFNLTCSVKNGWFHLDVWDHDEETTVMEVVKKSGDIQSVKGVRRLLKEVIQSTRLGGSNPDDFLGFVNIKLDSIPTCGLNGWFPLRSKSSRSKLANGEIRLKLKLSLQRPSQSYHLLSPVAVHRVLWFHIVHHEVARLDQLGAWDGQLPAAAETLLQQHAVQYEITDLHQSLCRWLAYSQECAMCVVDFRSVYSYGETLRSTWRPYALSAEEEQYLQKSFHDFIAYAQNMLQRQQDMFPPTNKPALRRLQYLLLCLAQINDMEFAERNQLFQPSLQGVVLSAIKVDIGTWYAKKYAEMVSTRPEVEQVSALAALTNAMSSQVQRLHKFVHSTYQTVFDIPYFSVLYTTLADKLMEDVSRILSSTVSSGVLDDVDAEEYSERSTALFELYLALRDFVGFSEHLSAEDQAGLEIKGYHKFFRKVVENWLNVSRKRAAERIQKAVELDQVALVDTMVKHSTSAVDVATCFAQIREFWKRLDWPDTVGSYVFVAKVTDDICQGAVNYANIIHEKLRANGYYDDEGQFDITDQLCIAINNIEQVRRSLAVMPATLGWKQIQAAMETEYGATAGRQCQDTLTTMMASADEDMVNVIGHVVQRVGERMRPDFGRFLHSLLAAHVQSVIDDAIDPLMEYLDTNMITLHNNLLKSNFERILQDIWIVLLDELNALMSKKTKVLQGQPLLFCRLNETLHILSDFFYAEEKGLALSILHSPAYLEMVKYTESNMSSTYELIEAFHCQKLQQVEEIIDSNSESPHGTLTVKCYYNNATHHLCVMLVNAKNVTPKDKSGTSDPYVILELQPSYIFPKAQLQKSQTVKETLNPLFDECFEFPVSREQCSNRGACLHLTMYDRDVITADDFEGETFLRLASLPGLGQDFSGSYSSLPSVPLPLMLPEDNADRTPFLLGALKHRASDKTAQEFAKKRAQLQRKFKASAS